MNVNIDLDELEDKIDAVRDDLGDKLDLMTEILRILVDNMGYGLSPYTTEAKREAQLNLRRLTD